MKLIIMNRSNYLTDFLFISLISVNRPKETSDTAEIIV